MVEDTHTHAHTVAMNPILLMDDSKPAREKTEGVEHKETGWLKHT